MLTPESDFLPQAFILGLPAQSLHPAPIGGQNGQNLQEFLIPTGGSWGKGCEMDDFPAQLGGSPGGPWGGQMNQESPWESPLSFGEYNSNSYSNSTTLG